MQRWKRYFSELLNEENQYELQDHVKVEGPILGVTVEEVEEALQKMKIGKALGPLGVTMGLLRHVWETGVRAEKGLRVDTEERAPKDWGSSYTIPVYNGKGEALLEHEMKLWEKILERRLRYS